MPLHPSNPREESRPCPQIVYSLFWESSVSADQALTKYVDLSRPHRRKIKRLQVSDGHESGPSPVRVPTHVPTVSGRADDLSVEFVLERASDDPSPCRPVVEGRCDLPRGRYTTIRIFPVPQKHVGGRVFELSPRVHTQIQPRRQKRNNSRPPVPLVFLQGMQSLFRQGTDSPRPWEEGRRVSGRRDPGRRFLGSPGTGPIPRLLRISGPERSSKLRDRGAAT